MILVAGENLIDLIPTGTDPGATPRLAALPGGSPFNCARALGRLGVPVGYLTPISTDPMGALLADTLRADGVALLGGRRDLPAAQAVVTLQGGEARYRFYRTGTADRDVTLAGLRAALPRARTALHTGSLALMDAPDADALAALLTQLAHAGVMTSVDPNIRATVLPPADEGAYRARLARILAHAGIIKMSVEDMRWLHPGTAPEEAAEALWQSGQPGLLVLTRGAAGVMAWHGSGRVTLPAAPVAALVDTVGAGDSFMAALLAGLHDRDALRVQALAGMGQGVLTAVLSRAARAAALTCTRQGCAPPSRAELDGAGGRSAP